MKKEKKEHPPTQHKNWIGFEMDKSNILNKVTFKICNGSFQDYLRNDLKKIKTANKISVKAEKSCKFYSLEPHAYNKMLEESVSEQYSKEMLNAEEMTLIS